MKSVKIELSKHIKEVKIVTLSDLHIGEANCDMKAVKETIDTILKDKSCYVILNGDLMNNATINGKSDSYAELLSPMEQVKRAVELLAPIKDRIISADTGNHERRTYRDDGIDIMYFVMAELGLTHLYSAEGNLVFIRFGHDGTHNRKLCYTLYHIHGTGGGREAGGKVKRLTDLSGIIDVDIYVHGHTHLPVTLKEGFFRVDRRNSTCSFVERLFVNTAATLNYGGYAQLMGYKPAAITSPIIILSGTKKDAKALL